MASFQNRTALLHALDPTDPLQQPAVQPGGMDLGAMSGTGGIASGEGSPNAGPPPVLDQPIAAPIGPADAPKPASDFGRTMGYDPGKFNDPNKHDFKYDTARVLSRFDPRQGLSPDVINALNGELGNTYGNFSGAGDKLSLTGAKGAKDAADFANQDWIYAHKDNSDATKWNFGGGGAPDAAAGGGGALAAGMGGGLPSQLQGDPMAMIQQALSKYGNSPNLQALLAQLGGGQ